MKPCRFILTIAAGVAAICSTLAFTARNYFNGRHQLFTKTSAPCHQVDVWTTAVGGTPVPLNRYYLDAACSVPYVGNAVLID